MVNYAQPIKENSIMDIQEKLHERRTVSLSNDINREQADKIRKKLLEFEIESDKEIYLLIDSTGGETQAAFSICDLISCLKAPVTGIVLGRCSSAAVTILQSCNKRCALKHTFFFLHFISVSFNFSAHLSDEEIEALFERRRYEGKDQQAKSEQLIATRTGKTVEEIRKLMLDGDVLDARLSAGEAMIYGLIDEIIENPKELLAERK